MTASDPKLQQGILPGGVLDEETFRRLLSLEAKRAARYQDFFGLCLVQHDVASPKGQTEEMLGHKVARKIVEFVRSSDVVGRLGDEIGVLLLQAGSGEALKVSARLRREIGSVRFQADDAGPGQSITLSVGAVSFPGDGNSPVSLVSLARARLEEAVRTGGNRIVKADDT